MKTKAPEAIASVQMGDKKIEKKCVAIVMFGPATVTSGMRPAEYFQVTIDPTHCSPTGEYIRFGLYPGDEIMGWQRVSAMTIVEVLSEFVDDAPPQTLANYQGAVTMRTLQ